MYFYWRRDCCGTRFDASHTDTCAVRGINALNRLACAPTTDGWCASHSTGAGPVYCNNPTPLAPTPLNVFGRTPAQRPVHRIR